MDYRKLLALPVLAVMASCAATNPTNTVVSDTVKSNVEQTKMLELTDEGKVPNWYVNIPEPGDEVMFVAGSGVSRDLTLASLIYLSQNNSYSFLKIFLWLKF